MTLADDLLGKRIPKLTGHTGRRVLMGTHRKPAKSPKYRNKVTERDGHRFDSKKEADRYAALCLLETAGRVRGLNLQVQYPLTVNGSLVCKYRADFVYEELQRDGSWAWVTEDVKGYKTPLYKLKKKLMRACHGIEVRET